MTAHLIDHKVDAGRIVVRREIPEYGDDSLIDLSLRIYETQIAMLGEVFEVLESTPVCSLQPVPKSKLNRSFPNEKLPEMSDRFTQRLLGLQSSTSK